MTPVLLLLLPVDCSSMLQDDGSYAGLTLRSSLAGLRGAKSKHTYGNLNPSLLTLLPQEDACNTGACAVTSAFLAATVP